MKINKKISLQINDFDVLKDKDYIIEISGIQKDGPIVERASQYAIMVEKRGVWNILYKHLKENQSKNKISNLQLSYNLFALDWMCYFQYKGKEILLMHPVMGASSAECLVQQAYTIGCESFIRIGTTGSLSTDIPLYSSIVTLASIRHDGTSEHYLPEGFPALADISFSSALSKQMKKRGMEVTEGISYTTSTRFRENLESLFKLNKELGVLNIEMESAAIFAVSKALKMRAASISLVSDCLASEDDTKEIEGTLKGVPQYSDYFTKGIPEIINMFEATLETIGEDLYQGKRYELVKKEIEKANYENHAD